MHVRNPKARITFKISHKMCSMNSLALAKKVCRNSRKPIKNLAGFPYRLAWHKRTNCLSLKLHRKICKIYTLNSVWQITIEEWMSQNSTKDEKFELNICLVTGQESHWSCFTVLNVLEKAKPEHFQTNWSVLIVCSVHLKLTGYFHGNKQRTLLKNDIKWSKNSSQLNSLCLGPDFIERKTSQHSLGKFCIWKKGFMFK